MAVERLHFLDWLRATLVCFVVYAHLVFCGAQVGRPDDDGSVDDHAYNLAHPNQLAVRWTSVARQWCIPLLFWTSGAASTLSWARGLRRGLVKLAFVSLVGVVANATVWLLGPRDAQCSFRQPCPGKGLLFDFTEDPYSGTVEPYVNQMWYTVALLFFLCLNWPLINAVNGHCNFFALLAQWALTLLMFGALGVAGDCPRPALLLLGLAASEAAFMALAVLRRPQWLPLRALHYACAMVAVLQLALLPFAKAPVVDDVTAGYVLFLLLGSNRWFQLGFLMVHGADAAPLASRAWPAVLLPLVFFCPSTNWSMAGVLPYPLLPRAVDRVLYVGGTAVVVFVVDRTRRGVGCAPLPPLLARAALVLYVLQAALVTIALQLLEHWARSQLGPQPGRQDRTGALLAVLGLAMAASLVIGAVAPLSRRRGVSRVEELSLAAEA